MAQIDERTTPIWYSLKVGDRGRIVLPAELRERLGVKENDRLLARVEEDGSLRVITARAAWDSIRGILKERLPHLGDRSLADELIAERRAEAARE